MKLIDLTGKTFGKLTVIGRAENHISKNGNSRTAWLCKCECGNEVVVMGLNLTRNHTTSCGCAHKEENKRRMLDVTNQRFGKLVALHPVDNDRKGVYWLFRCDCGCEKEMLLQNVKTGKSMSCGKCKNNLGTLAHTQKGIIGNTFDLTGQRFDKLIAVERFIDENMVKYLCRCDCGNECIKTHTSLKYGTKTNGTNSCGCIQRNAASKMGRGGIESLIGKRFNHLVVIEQAETKYRKFHWLCKCDCGNTTIVSTSGLISGHTQSCGCYQDEVASDTHFNDLSGKKYGMLTVMKRVENDSAGNVQYLCKCDCGNQKVIRGLSISFGMTTSCGCAHQSMGELFVDDVLFDLNINYNIQVKFDGLTGLGQYPLTYDFGIYENEKIVGLIEYQGQQHFEPIDYFGGKEKFEQQQFHDELKREYARDTLKVPLLEIPYTVRTYDDIFDVVKTFCDSLFIQKNNE